MEKQDYIDAVFAILDDAARDKSLSLKDYREVCDEVSTDAHGRYQAACSDLDNEEE